MGLNHSLSDSSLEPTEFLTELDLRNAEDMVIIAIELLYEIKIYDFSVVNPVNYVIIAMCDFALCYFP